MKRLVVVKKGNKLIRFLLCIVLLVMGIAFCIAAFLGHRAAYSAAAVCFFAVLIIKTSQS